MELYYLNICKVSEDLIYIYNFIFLEIILEGKNWSMYVALQQHLIHGIGQNLVPCIAYRLDSWNWPFLKKYFYDNI